MSAFLEMGGYGAYVWPCYAATLIVLGLAIAFSVSSHRRAQAEVRHLEAQNRGEQS